MDGKDGSLGSFTPLRQWGLREEFFLCKCHQVYHDINSF